jgi:DNA-directed RNA polymerase subunit RPC12/RpoP
VTDWSQYRRYRCHVCGEPCINHLDKEQTEYTECAECFSIPSLDQAPEADSDDAHATPAE